MMPRISNGSQVYYTPSDHVLSNVESSSSASSVVAGAESIPWRPDNRSRVVVAESTTAQNVFFSVVVVDAVAVDPAADKVWWGLRASKHSLWTCPLIIFVSCHQEDMFNFLKQASLQERHKDSNIVSTILIKLRSSTKYKE